LIRLEDWWRGAGAAHSELDNLENAKNRVARNSQDLLDALKSATQNSNVPYLLCFCPASRSMQANDAAAAFLTSFESQIAARSQDVAGVYIVTSADLAAMYPVAEYDDPKANQAGHVPYTRGFYHALGTIIVRRFYRIHTPPHKVIVLDCDNTLWQGVCGEDGTLGVKVDPSYRKLQEFIIAQRDAGMLVCLCSKNNPDDAWKVFENNPGMVLRREHITASRIDWRPKSENIRSLAAELQLGLDSFIFIDDSAIECAEVEAGCPEVLTLQLPGPGNDFAKFLCHVWAFDHLKITDEDCQRSSLYAQNSEREQLRTKSAGLEDFLAGLELQVEFLAMSKAELPRVAQLTQRTNQFNFTALRFSENELDQFCSADDAGCIAVRVRDRFGDYGLVGAMLLTREKGLLDVTNVLLSCRALGRRVEHKMLSHLAGIALQEGRETIRIHFVPTRKNQPAREFLESLGSIPDGADIYIDFESIRVVSVADCAGTSAASSISANTVGDVVHQI
jgi:FkbH-like protein